MVDVHITLTVTGADDVPLKITASDGAELTLGMPFYSDHTPAYEGEYTVHSKPYVDIVMPTADKRMEEDVTVERIPYALVSNPEGGATATIGD